MYFYCWYQRDPCHVEDSGLLSHSQPSTLAAQAVAVGAEFSSCLSTAARSADFIYVSLLKNSVPSYQRNSTFCLRCMDASSALLIADIHDVRNVLRNTCLLVERNAYLLFRSKLRAKHSLGHKCSAVMIPSVDFRTITTACSTTAEAPSLP